MITTAERTAIWHLLASRLPDLPLRDLYALADDIAAVVRPRVGPGHPDRERLMEARHEAEHGA